MADGPNPLLVVAEMAIARGEEVRKNTLALRFTPSGHDYESNPPKFHAPTQSPDGTLTLLVEFPNGLPRAVARRKEKPAPTPEEIAAEADAELFLEEERRRLREGR